MILTGIPSEMKTDFQFMKKLSEYTRLNPDVRIDTIHKMAKRIEPELKKNGLHM